MSLPSHQAAQPADLGLDLLWEVPLALLSWAFFHANKALIAVLYQRHLDREGSRSRQWRILSAETLRLPLSLPVLQTKGPRWNTHATIGTLGPLPVRQSLAVQTGLAQRSAEAWSVVLYRYPDFATFRELGSLDPSVEGEWSQLELPSGRYVLGVRYYGLRDDALLPAIRLDGSGEAVAAEPLPEGVNAVYDHLAERTSWYHHALHHYIHPTLRLRRWLPAGLVRREFLPVGDPFTRFRYGWFAAGTQLQVHCAPALLRSHRVYLSVYNRASLPVHSAELVAPESSTPLLGSAGFYLFRLRPRQRDLPDCREEDLVVRHLAGPKLPDGAGRSD